MSDNKAPDRIWIDNNPYENHWHEGTPSAMNRSGVYGEYVRADLVPQWQPIDTAPKDGTSFLGWNKSHGAHECCIPTHVAHYKKPEAVYGNHPNSAWFRLTHWMPLPKAPSCE